FPALELAGQHRAAVLQLPHHGGTGHGVHCDSCDCCVKIFRGTLYGSKIMLWALMLALPFPFIANTAGWITAEVGRQPWLIYGLMRTSAGVSPLVSAGNAWFTLLGFLGMYMILGILFLYL